MTIYVCDCCGEAEEVIFECEKCHAVYCSDECIEDDRELHERFCEASNEETIKAALRFFQIDLENHTPLKDKSGNRYLQFPGKILGDLPKCMLDLHVPDKLGIKIWRELGEPFSTLDMWYYLVKYEDLAKFILRMNSIGCMSDLLIRLHLSSPKKS